jgi:hypothetical protein
MHTTDKYPHAYIHPHQHTHTQTYVKFTTIKNSYHRQLPRRDGVVGVQFKHWKTAGARHGHLNIIARHGFVVYHKLRLVPCVLVLVHGTICDHNIHRLSGLYDPAAATGELPHTGANRVFEGDGHKIPDGRGLGVIGKFSSDHHKLLNRHFTHGDGRIVIKGKFEVHGIPSHSHL